MIFILGEVGEGQGRIVGCGSLQAKIVWRGGHARPITDQQWATWHGTETALLRYSGWRPTKVTPTPCGVGRRRTEEGGGWRMEEEDGGWRRRTGEDRGGSGRMVADGGGWSEDGGGWWRTEEPLIPETHRRKHYNKRIQPQPITITQSETNETNETNENEWNEWNEWNAHKSRKPTPENPNLPNRKLAYRSAQSSRTSGASLPACDTEPGGARQRNGRISTLWRAAGRGSGAIGGKRIGRWSCWSTARRDMPPWWIRWAKPRGGGSRRKSASGPRRRSTGGAPPAWKRGSPACDVPRGWSRPDGTGHRTRPPWRARRRSCWGDPWCVPVPLPLPLPPPLPGGGKMGEEDQTGKRARRY